MGFRAFRQCQEECKGCGETAQGVPIVQVSSLGNLSLRPSPVRCGILHKRYVYTPAAMTDASKRPI